MVQHSIVTMFQVFMALVTVVFIVGAASAMKTVWRAMLERHAHKEPAPDTADGETFCSEPESPPTGR
jgi:hypothetical protein